MTKRDKGKYLEGLRDAFDDKDFMAIEFLLMWVVFALLALVALGVESIIYRMVGG